MMVSKWCVVVSCSSYSGKPLFLLWIRFVNRNDQQQSFTSFVVCINQSEEKFQSKEESINKLFKTCAEYLHK